MQIGDYIKIFLKRWWIIAMVIAVALASGYGFSKLQPRVYQASVKLLAEPSKPDYGLDLFIQSRLSSYQQLLSTREIAQKVIDQNKLDILPEQLLSNINVKPIPDQSIVEVTVDDLDPQRAQLIANSLADVFVQTIEEKNATLADTELRVDVSKLDTPLVPAQPYKPNTKVNTLAAGVLGLILGCLLAFGLEFVDDTIKTTEDVQRYLSLPVLGSIPPSKAGGDRESRSDGGQANSRASTKLVQPEGRGATAGAVGTAGAQSESGRDA